MIIPKQGTIKHQYADSPNKLAVHVVLVVFRLVLYSL